MPTFTRWSVDQKSSLRKAPKREKEMVGSLHKQMLSP